MIFDPEAYLRAEGISYSKTGKHARPGWIQIRCPFCSGHKGWHGGFNIAKEYYNCWRCGWHSLIDVIMSLSRISYSEAKLSLKRHRTLSSESINNERKGGDIRRSPFSLRIDKGDLKMPPSCGPLSTAHQQYLIDRGFDPDELIKEWGLQATKGIGAYKFRVVAPIYFKGQLVSYQGRDISDKANAKYMACALEDEIIHHKHILYGIDKAKTKTAIIVEGITDVWRIGPGAVGTFGIKFTSSQIRVLLDFFTQFFILFDPDAEAQNQAEKLGEILMGFNRDVEIIETEKDPGDMTSSEALALKKELLNN